MTRDYLRTTASVLAIALLLTAPLTAQRRVRIRLATLAPEASTWVDALRAMGDEWRRDTDGRVRMTVYASTLPSEASALTRLELGSLEAATLTAVGLAELDSAFNVFGLPFFFDSDEQLAHVQRALTPMFQERLQARGFRLLHWGNAGWVQLFSKDPIHTLAELKNTRMFTSEGNDPMVQWYTRSGFTVTPLPFGEIPKQLKLPNGAISAAPSPPIYALATRMFEDAPFMLDVRVAPLTSATIITERAWQQLSAADRVQVLAAAARTERLIQESAPSLDAGAIREMREAGLTVVTLDRDEAESFAAAARELESSAAGSMLPREVLEKARGARAEYRGSRTPRQ